VNLNQLELALAPPPVTAWASKLASGVEDWSSDSNFRLLSDLSQKPRWDHRDLDYMHARFNSPLTGRFLSVDPAGARPNRPQSWNRYSYVRGNPLTYVDPDGRKDTRTTADVALLEDDDILAGVADNLDLTGLDKPMLDRQEVMSIVADEGGGDYSIDGMVTQGSIFGVSANLPSSGGTATTFSGKKLGATIHSHTGTGFVLVGGQQMALTGGASSTADQNQAKQLQVAVYILNADANLLKVSVRDGKAVTTKIMTGKDYSRYLARARTAQRAKRVMQSLQFFSLR
jgi:RHS repeat-associated protein